MKQIHIAVDDVDWERIVKLAQKDGITVEARTTRLLHLGIAIALKEHNPGGGAVPDVERTLATLYEPGTYYVYPGSRAKSVYDVATGIWTAVPPDGEQ